jgi:hypothetical protein
MDHPKESTYEKAIKTDREIEILWLRGDIPTKSGRNQENGDPRVTASHGPFDRYGNPGTRRG